MFPAGASAVVLDVAEVPIVGTSYVVASLTFCPKVAWSPTYANLTGQRWSQPRNNAWSISTQLYRGCLKVCTAPPQILRHYACVSKAVWLLVLKLSLAGRILDTCTILRPICA